MVKGKSKQHKEHVVDTPNLDISTLTFSAIYGANGAGKSNFIKAIKFAKNLITDNNFDSEDRDLYCRINPENQNKNTDFEFELLLNGNVYSYGFSINLYKKIFIREWLYLISNNKEVEIFTYDKATQTVNIPLPEKNTKNKIRFEIYSEDYLSQNSLDSSLFLHFVNSSKSRLIEENNEYLSAINEIFYWFKNSLDIIQPNSKPKHGLTYLNNSDTTTIENFLNDFGTGIKKIIKAKISIDEIYRIEDKNFIDYVSNDIKDKAKNKEGTLLFGMLKTKRNIYLAKTTITNKEDYKTEWFIFKFSSNKYTEYALGELSDGTIRLIELYSILNNKKDITFFVDELDRSLHPNLTFNFIKYFLKHKKRSQLIVTTHEDRILDLNILRRDEIWFVEKDDNGTSQLYSLEKFKIRFDQDVMKAYLDGRYGSIPKFKFLI
ncbi:AAA family ATPase [Acinetobacter courvalinii]|uniref:AAA family ATPase n=1 Tax=Acinetobacter courvalinii TaxID=280147 RepID=UPI00289640B2|nr:AAA family ATPase [Acinetobacter courvalinii]